MDSKTVARILGVIFIAVGVLGFIPNPPNPLVSAGGLFHVDAAHNLVHLVTGGLLLFVASNAMLKIVGVLYAVVAVLGLVTYGAPTLLFGYIAMNTADSWLHLILAVVILAAGWMTSDPAPSTTSI
ncbi:MAG: DUF4383 domain-containing protein [Hyphomicrobiaceae bacterium]